MGNYRKYMSDYGNNQSTESTLRQWRRLKGAYIM